MKIVQIVEIVETVGVGMVSVGHVERGNLRGSWTRGGVRGVRGTTTSTSSATHARSRLPDDEDSSSTSARLKGNSAHKDDISLLVCGLNHRACVFHPHPVVAVAHIVSMLRLQVPDHRAESKQA